MNEKQTEKSDVARREEEVLAFWAEHDIFNKSLNKESPKGDFVFYDGPPFATGLPHYGHILAGTIKDAIPRFWTMNGYHVKRKWGWDCHGLPIENIIEKKLGLATKRDIEELGVKKFNETARDTVLEYADDWRRIIPRMGRWVDMDNDYKTMDATYTESVWWVFSELNKKGLVYEGFKSMHLCPRCGTTLSNFEVNQGYKDIKDIAVTVKMPLLDEAGKATDTSILIWTTTPWTLPGNMAVAVNNEIEYVKVRITIADQGTIHSGTGTIGKPMDIDKTFVKGEKYILAKARLAQLGTDQYEILETMKGRDLVGTSYQPPFDYIQKQELPGKEKAWKIYHADYVELGEEGTGAVHIAPAYGEEDMELAKREGVPMIHHVDETGHFMDFVTDFAGQLVKPKDDEGVDHKEADIKILKKLQENGTVLRKETISHTYPHCWRCDTPLLNYATTSWFVRVTDIKESLVTENSTVSWIPEHVGKARFGKWLEGARDWAISRQRYWGAPLPIWRNPKTKEYRVLSSLADIQERVHQSGNTYFLTRHGESELNTTGTLNGVLGVKNSLTPKGKGQVDEAAQKLAHENIDIIYYSPLERTTETATRIAEALGLGEDALIPDNRLMEMQFGVFEQRHVSEYYDFFGGGHNQLIKHPDGGESWTDVKCRAGAFLYEIDKRHEGKRILIVSHNGVLQMLQGAAYGTNAKKLAGIIDDDSFDMQNAEVREMPFTHMPHNDTYELDFHRPYIDDIELFDEDGERLVRVPDVFDCWFESGSMPYAQNHYPFEHLDTFNAEKGVCFPAQFIAEGVDQTRGWFYSLIVLGTALFGKSPYEHVIVNGLVLAEDGKKMSKKLQNYPDPMDVADRVGVDAIRYYLLSSPIVRGEDLNFSEKEVQEQQRKNIGRLHNVLAMYEMYADTSVSAHTHSTHVLDVWVLSRTHEMVREVTQGYRAYELDRATRPIADLIEDVSVWYLRRSRERLKGDDLGDTQATLATLRYVLKTLALAIAPVMPFYAEYLFLRVREEGDAESVHLMDWPEVGDINEQSIVDMGEARRLTSFALEARAKANVKVRQPLGVLTIRKSAHGIGYLHEIIADEVNVKHIEVSDDMQQEVSLDLTITPELKREGDVRELIRSIQETRKNRGLNPHDRIELIVDEQTKTLITGFESDVQSVVGADTVCVESVGEDGQTVTIDGVDHRYDVRLK